MGDKKELLININTASKDELTKIRGIGEKLAQEMIKHRPFLQVEDLVNVPGISESKLKTLLPYITISVVPSKKPRPKQNKPLKPSIEKDPTMELGDTEAFVFLEDRNERQDALLIILGGFIIGLIILLLRRNKE
jgi:competence ComEA-like helix-hairpin-helix protein